MEWVEKVIKPFMAAQLNAGVADESTRYLLFEDNLAAQKEQKYIDALKACGVDDHKAPPAPHSRTACFLMQSIHPASLRCLPTTPTRCSRSTAASGAS